MPEETIFSNDRVCVTPTRFTTPGRTLVLKTVTSVRFVEVPPNTGFPTMLLVCGVFGILVAVGMVLLGVVIPLVTPGRSDPAGRTLAALLDGACCTAVCGPIPLLMAALGGLLLMLRQTSFVIRVATPYGGEKVAYRARTSSEAEQVLIALNEALTRQ